MGIDHAIAHRKSGRNGAPRRKNKPSVNHAPSNATIPIVTAIPPRSDAAWPDGPSDTTSRSRLDPVGPCGPTITAPATTRIMPIVPTMPATSTMPGGQPVAVSLLSGVTSRAVHARVDLHGLIFRRGARVR